MRLVLASRNTHKLAELAELLAPHEIEPLPPEIELPPETATTFSGNALAKARAAAVASGRPAVGDDSGIAAAALRGAPGVFSARFAGEGASDEDNLAKLLRDVPADADRGVAYVCAVVYVEPGGAEQVVEAHCEGRLAAEPRGTGGFGYDPAFIPSDRDDGRTMAELSPEEKHAISHRGRAARELVDWLAGENGGSPRLPGPFELPRRGRRRGGAA